MPSGRVAPGEAKGLILRGRGMGGVKSLWMEQVERGYGSSEHFVCHNCVDEEELKDFIIQMRQNEPCTYCGYSEAASVEEFTGYILDCLMSEWEHYDSKRDEGANEFSFREVICFEEPIYTEQEALIDEIERIVDTDFWVRTWNYNPKEDDEQEAWHNFTRFVTHSLRFTSFLPEAGDIFRNVNHTRLPVDTGMKYILKTIEQYGLVKELGVDTNIYRVRLTDDLDNYGTGTEMGTVPRREAKTANRMSPVGIPMFYGAFSPDVALSEVKRKESHEFQHIATFAPSRSLFVADFTELPSLPSIFSENSSFRQTVFFLKRFAEELSKPLNDDDLDHLEYLPSQIVTEYLKLMCRHKGSFIDGIVYKSAQTDGKCIVLFVENEQCLCHQPYPEDENYTTFSERIGMQDKKVKQRPRLHLILSKYSASGLER